MREMLGEADIKAILIEYLLNKRRHRVDCSSKHHVSEYCLINEFGFDGMPPRRRADLVELDMDMHVYEIKSDKDTLKNLRWQCDGYKRFFNRVSVVITERHLKAIRAGGHLPKGTGLLLVKDGAIHELRRAFLCVRQKPSDLVQIISTPQLNSMLKAKDVRYYYNYLKYQKQEWAQKHYSARELSRLARYGLRDKYRMSHRWFMAYRYFPVQPADIKLFAEGFDRDA